MGSIEIVDLFSCPHRIPEAVAWMLREWPKAGSGVAATVERALCGDRDPHRLPVPLVALRGDALVGLVSLNFWEKGSAFGQPHWINAVIVAPHCRRQGLGLALVQAAERRARELGVTELHALTPYPGLYEKLDWFPFYTPLGERDVVMKKLI